jgi:hypothetical protein
VQLRGRVELEPQPADLGDLVLDSVVKEPDVVPGAHRAVHHPHQADHAPVLVELGVEDEGAQRRVGAARRRRHVLDYPFEQLRHAEPGLRADAADVFGGHARDVLDLERDFVRAGGGQVDLVDRADDRSLSRARKSWRASGLDPARRPPPGSRPQAARLRDTSW